MKLSNVLIALGLLFSPMAHANNSVGMNVHNGTPGFIAASADLGVAWVRLDGNWLQLEPTNDNHNWGFMDAAVNTANMAGLSVFMTLAYTPDWVPRHGNTDNYSGNDVPNASTEWTDFVSDAVTHYRALGVRHFGLWNEANLQGFWEGTLAEYVNTIVIPGAAAVRSVCNDCFVLGPELANVGDADDYLEGVLSAVPAGTFDIITHHNYGDFEETGWRIWDGDSFINQLDMQRFTFTRRSLRQVLDSVGYSGEVWISETGYRATPGDANEENLQAIYVRRVLEEQLQRAWYTNTFFYEINDCGVDQPSCTIDGFGLMRPTAGMPGARNFPTDFRLKPAFVALRDFITNNPSIVGTQPPMQCGDGLDNDGDGRIDLADRGCEGAADDDESNDPPRLRLVAQRTQGVVLDGDLAEFSSFLTLLPEAWQGTEPLGTDDLEVSVAALWSTDGLFLAVEVVDDMHDNTHGPAELWQGDSVQLGFDVNQNGGSSYDAVDDHEVNFARAGPAMNEQVSAFRFHGPAAATDEFDAAIARVGNVTRYEIFMPQSALPNASFTVGAVIGFTFLVNDSDGLGRIGWKEWTPGVGNGKEPELFGELRLAEMAPGADAGVVDAGAVDSGELDAGGVDASQLLDQGVGIDAAREDLGQKDAGFADGGSQDLSDGPPAQMPGKEGCGCSTHDTRQGSAWALSLLGVLALMILRPTDRADRIDPSHG